MSKLFRSTSFVAAMFAFSGVLAFGAVNSAAPANVTGIPMPTPPMMTAHVTGIPMPTPPSVTGIPMPTPPMMTIV